MKVHTDQFMYQLDFGFDVFDYQIKQYMRTYVHNLVDLVKMQSELLLASIFCLFLKILAEPIVEIEDGILLGTYGDSASGKLHSKFLGIPFAKPPVNKLKAMLKSVF